LAERLVAAGVSDAPLKLTRSLNHFDTWRHPGLLLGQGCEYPLAKSFAGCMRLVATPRYAVPGCDGPRYRSAIVVRAEDSAETLGDLRHRRCVVNEPDSNSGMNLLRAAVAPIARGVRFFESVSLSGSHRRSVEMVMGGQADVAAVDCISFAHIQRLQPATAAALRILCWTPASRSPPFITGIATDDATFQVLRSALAGVITDSTLAPVRENLFLQGLDLDPDGRLTDVLDHERQAAGFGYPALL
jgi:ABC-type phosphate/phosphonate transport system substrate-binding protein